MKRKNHNMNNDNTVHENYQFYCPTGVYTFSDNEVIKKNDKGQLGKSFFSHVYSKTSTLKIISSSKVPKKILNRYKRV